MLKTAAIISVVAAAGAASASTVPVIVDGSALSPVTNERVNARFRADRTNWDMRVADNGNPTPGEAQRNVANGTTFEGQTFDFALSFDSSTDNLNWSITRPDAQVFSLDLDLSDFGALNTVQLSGSGSRGNLNFSPITFSGFGGNFDGFDSIDVNRQNGPTFANTFAFFGNGFDLLSENWSITGSVMFSDLTTNNPQDGAAFNIRLTNAAVTAIPTPTAAAAGLLGLGGLAARRRR